jgi:hypothetical protein
MFHPLDHPLERGWVGRIDGERVVHLAAQTLQSFFTGGGTVREHAEYELTGVRMLAPVLHPPAVRVFDADGSFAFANPAAIVGPGARVARPARSTASDTVSQGSLSLVPRLAAIVGANDALAGFTALAEWRDRSREKPKDRDFALGLGPIVVTADALRVDGLGALARVAGRLELTGAFVDFDWTAAASLAADGTVLRPGDVLAGPGLGLVEIEPGASVELEVEGIGVLDQTLEG